MATYPTRVKRDIARWREAGLVDQSTAEALSFDVERNSGRGISFGAVLTMMAAALFAAAVLIFIAANWEEIPRLMRVFMLLALIFAGYVGGALFKLSGRETVGEASWLVAAAGFGASIALIAQIYHLSGDEVQAVFVWGVGVALAAAALRSGPLTAGAVLLAGVWMVMVPVYSSWDWSGPPLAWLGIAIVLYGLSFWTRSALARHLILLSLYLFVVMFYIDHDSPLHLPLVLAGAAAILLVLSRLRPVETQHISGLSAEALPIQALFGFLIAVGIMQIMLINRESFILPTILALAGIVAALLLAGRDNRLLRWFAYLAFAFQLCFLYVVMLGSMIDTAGFFLFAGLILSVLAFLISRFELAMATGPASKGEMP